MVYKGQMGGVDIQKGILRMGNCRPFIIHNQVRGTGLVAFNGKGVRQGRLFEIDQHQGLWLAVFMIGNPGAARIRLFSVSRWEVV